MSITICMMKITTLPKIRKNYTYHDNGKKSSETTNVIPGDVKTVIKYDINEERIEKTEQRGAVKPGLILMTNR